MSVLKSISMLAAAAVLSVIAGCGSQPQKASANQAIELVVGTYSQKGSEGVYTMDFIPASNSFSEPKLMAKLANPSFVRVAKDNTLYIGIETGDGAITTFKPDGDGFSLKGQAATNGASPCYIAIGPNGDFLASANYMGGNVSVFNLDDAGVVEEGPQILQHTGKGPNKNRQEAAHAHWVQWDKKGKHIYAVDLGIDQVKVYPFDKKNGQSW